MSKPIDNIHLIKDICPRCEPVSEIFNGMINFITFVCIEHDIGRHDKPCTLGDWAVCSSNKETTAPEKKESSSSYLDDLKKLKFESRYRFYWGCQHYFHKFKKNIDAFLAILPMKLDLDKAADRDIAWREVVKKFSGGELRKEN